MGDRHPAPAGGETDTLFVIRAKIAGPYGSGVEHGAAARLMLLWSANAASSGGALARRPTMLSWTARRDAYSIS
jgi:hypothetical protein